MCKTSIKTRIEDGKKHNIHELSVFQNDIALYWHSVFLLLLTFKAIASFSINILLFFLSWQWQLSVYVYYIEAFYFSLSFSTINKIVYRNFHLLTLNPFKYWQIKIVYIHRLHCIRATSCHIRNLLKWIDSS